MNRGDNNQRDQRDQRDQRNQRNQRQNPEQRNAPGRSPVAPFGPGTVGPMMPPPGFPPQRPGRVEEPPMMPPGFPPPGQGAQEMAPRTAPPNFIPEMPDMEKRSYGQPYGGGGQMTPYMQIRPRELRRCLNRFTFIWLINGNSFWFYPTFLDRQFVYGFRWRRNQWEYDRLNVNRIIFSRCF